MRGAASQRPRPWVRRGRGLTSPALQGHASFSGPSASPRCPPGQQRALPVPFSSGRLDPVQVSPQTGWTPIEVGKVSAPSGQRGPALELAQSPLAVGLVGLVIAPLMILNKFQDVAHFGQRIGQPPLQQPPRLRQGQGRGFFLYLSRSRSRNSCAKNTRRMCRCQAGQERCS